MIDHRIEVLKRAFLNDPLFNFLWPDERQRTRHIGTVIEFFLVASSRVITLDHSNGECAAVAGVAGPGEYPLTFFKTIALMPVLVKMMLSSLSPTPLTMMRKFVRLYSGVERIHPRLPHWYILIIGVDPAHQGQSFGGRLLKKVLGWADEQGVLVYLECSNPNSLDFYARHGFEVKEQIIIPHGGPSIWGLSREPSPPLKDLSI